MEWLLNLDGAILLWIQSLRVPALSAAMCFLTRLGDVGLIWIVISLLMLIPKRTRRAGMMGLLAMGVGLLIANLTIKPLVARPRPFVTLEGLTALIEEKDPASFPSGHACAAFAACFAWWPDLAKRYRRIPLAGAAVMAFSRLYVGVHFPGDVLAGAIIGTLCALLVRGVDRKLRARGN